MSYDEETTMDDVQMSFDVLGVLCVEGSPTGDGRMIDTNSLRWSLPLPLRRVREDFGAHNGAVVVGAIEKIERTETGELAYSGKLFDTADGRACRDEMYTRYMSSGLKYGISVDLDDVVVEDDADVMVVKSGRLRGATLCDVPAYSEAWTMLLECLDDANSGGEVLVASAEERCLLLAMDRSEVRAGLRELLRSEQPEGSRAAGEGASLGVGASAGANSRGIDYRPSVPSEGVRQSRPHGSGHVRGEHAASESGSGRETSGDVQARASVDGEVHEVGYALPQGRNPVSGEAMRSVRDRAALDAHSLIAAAPRAGVPAEWFADPNLTGPTPLTVTEDGRVYGHAALWNTCHLSFQDTCVMAPRSATNYAYYRTGLVTAANGEKIPVGHITLGTGHANARLAAAPAADHYDNTGATVSDVAAGEDQWGIWLAGAVREGVTDAQIRELQAHAVSGDWRTIDGNLELVAMLSVNVPGFGVPRMRAMVAGGVVQSLVASAVFDSEDVVEEPSTEMPPAEVAAALEPEAEAEESKVKAEMGDDAEEKVEDQPDAEDAEEATEEEVEDGEMDMAATMGEMRDMMRAMAEEIRMMKESMAMPAVAGDEPALADAPAEDAEPVEPLPAVENAVSAEEMLKMLDEMVNGKPDMTKLLAELDAKVG
jgi:hypothetical protein